MLVVLECRSAGLAIAARKSVPSAAHSLRDDGEGIGLAPAQGLLQKDKGSPRCTEISSRFTSGK
jgi:hypothetical protein